jgi:hypothetical protein
VPAEATWDSSKVTAIREASPEGGMQADGERRAAWSDQTPSDIVPLPGSRETARESGRPADGQRRATPRPANERPSGPRARVDGARPTDSERRALARSADQTPSGLSLVPPPHAERSSWKRRMVLTLVFLVFLATGLAATLVVSLLVR